MKPMPLLLAACVALLTACTASPTAKTTAGSTHPPLPVPTTVSPEAQALLAKPVDMSVHQLPLPETTEQWLTHIAASNQRFDGWLQAALAGGGVSIEQSDIAGVAVRTITPDALPAHKVQKVLINLHGGGYTMFGGKYSVIEGLGLARAGNFKVVAVDYRMPPLHPFPAAVDDGVAVYEALLEQYAPDDIGIFGASAGGGLTAAVIVAARDRGLPLPAAAVLNTPWSDLSKTGDSYYANDGVDPVLSSYDGTLGAMAQLYAGDAGLKHPLVSPVYADYAPGFPPTLLVSGTRDLLLSPTVRLHRALRAAGIEADLHVFEAMWHGFNTVPEGAIAQAEAVAFLEEKLGVSAND